MTMRSLELEQVREAFRENICPVTEGDPSKARKYIAEILCKGPDANAKGNTIPSGTTLYTWMEGMINEAHRIKGTLQESGRYLGETHSREPSISPVRDIGREIPFF